MLVSDSFRPIQVFLTPTTNIQQKITLHNSGTSSSYNYVGKDSSVFEFGAKNVLNNHVKLYLIIMTVVLTFGNTGPHTKYHGRDDIFSAYLVSGPLF